MPLFDGNGYAGDRRVIDVSGDGPNNRGRPVTAARDEAVAKGIVINGLPILNDRPQPFDLPTPMAMALDRYYADQVIGGPGSFVLPAQDFADFRTAILNKLIREIAADDRRPSCRALDALPCSLTAAEFEALATEGVPYVGQLGCRVERFEPGCGRRAPALPPSCCCGPAAPSAVRP